MLDIEETGVLGRYLAETGRVAAGEVVDVRPLAGGVSNRTMLVERADGTAWVVKQPLERLRVAVEWTSSVERIHREALGLRWLAVLCGPGAVPALVFEDLEQHVLAMEAIRPADGYKQRLLAGDVDVDLAGEFGRLLAAIHGGGHERRDELAPAFADWSAFEDLRLEPYYAYAADASPAAARFLPQLVADTRARRLTLVHGDYSPKNVLVHEGRLVLLDLEVAHFGDPAFDLGFGLAHLLSKAHHVVPARAALAAAASRFWSDYREALGEPPWADELQGHAVEHAIGCLHARVAGRSPLEYLDESERARQLTVATALMDDPPPSVAALVEQFVEACRREGG